MFFMVTETYPTKSSVEAGKVYVPFFSIEGWKFTVEPLLSVEEALPLVGL